MNSETFHLDLITPCFCGGAEPERQAEIRAPFIRGQLRCWFRTLGGFKALAPTPTPQQEAMIFGSTAGDEGRAGKLVVRVSALAGKNLCDSTEHPTPDMSQPVGYLLFPLRQQVRKKSALPSFVLTTQWRGDPKLWQDILGLVGVFGNLGALGFRGRRAMGSLAFKEKPPELDSALDRFVNRNAILIKRVGQPDPMTKEECIPALAKWLRGWRQHGQMWRRWEKHSGKWILISTAQQAQNRSQAGFPYARRDHNEGLDVQGTGAPNPDPEAPLGNQGETFRAALGLPIIQYFSSLEDNWGQQLKRSQATVNWTPANGGRLASPVLLRPHRDAQNKWHALVIFLESKATETPKSVLLTAKRWNPRDRREEEHIEPRDVSLKLYEAMRDDTGGFLRPFP